MKKVFLMMSLFLGALLLVNCGDKKSSSGSDDDEDADDEQTEVSIDDEDADDEQTEVRSKSRKKSKSRDAYYDEERSSRSERSSSSQSPQAVVEKFLNGMKNHDADVVLSCVDLERVKRKGGMPTDEEMEREFNYNGGVSSYSITESFEDEPGIWVIRSKVVYNNGKSRSMSYKLKKSGGRWVIAN